MEISKKEMLKVQDKWRDELIERRNKLGSNLMNVCLLSDGNDPASAIYLNNKMKRFKELNIPLTYRWWPRFYDGDILRRAIHEAQAHGTQVMVQLPLSNPTLDITEFTNEIELFHDIDAMKPDNSYVIPPVANGIRYFLRHYDKEVTPVDIRPGDLAVVVGRSKWVGEPIARMLNNDFNLTVAQLNHRTIKSLLNSLVSQAKLVISCAGHYGIINGESFSEKSDVSIPTMVVDVGTNKIDGKLHGDVASVNSNSYPNIYVTPVPGGVGPLTVLGLADNAITLSEKKVEKGWMC